MRDIFCKNIPVICPNYLIHRAEQLENLYIFTNTEGTPENIRKFHPNLIVSSTGSAPLLPPIWKIVKYYANVTKVK